MAHGHRTDTVAVLCHRVTLLFDEVDYRRGGGRVVSGSGLTVMGRPACRWAVPGAGAPGGDRTGATNDRIEALVADMRMITGEFKIVAMDALLTAIVERQSAMMDEMRQMHGLLMPPMMERQMHDVLPAWSDEEPGRMCAPEF